MGNENWGNEAFFCDECGEIFRSPLFCVTRAFECMHFYEAPRQPEAEVTFADAIANYCSSECLNKNRDRILERDGVKLTFPGPGPIELCSRCGSPVDMTCFHKTWSEEESICCWGESLSSIQPLNVQLLAVACQGCEASPNAIGASEEIASTKGRHLNALLDKSEV